jgi:hypothetical protein
MHYLRPPLAARRELLQHAKVRHGARIGLPKHHLPYAKVLRRAMPI